ncbi:MAG TPA: DUF1127 domain-containing protein [Stellaceae bacterium]|nr:DUF1127 domain-containing protein [Stellaceae bacterium]
MTAIEFRASYGRPRHAPRVAKGWMIRALATVREWRRRAKGRGELRRLDDRMLSDIGISRAEADFLSQIPFWRAS